MLNKIKIQELLSGHTDLLSEVKSSSKSALPKAPNLLFVTDLPVDMYVTMLMPWLDILDFSINFQVIHPIYYLEHFKVLDSRDVVTIYLLSNFESFELLFSELKNSALQSESFLVRLEQQRLNSTLLTKDTSQMDLKILDVQSLIVKDIYESNMSLQEITFTTHALLNILEKSMNPRYTKLLVIDLDNTLYSGEISEGKSSSIFFNDMHRAAIDFYIKLSQQGVFIEVLTRNSSSVLNDLKLQPVFNEFAKVVSKFNFVDGSKGKVLKERISFYNFLEDSVTVIDDNPAELIDILQHNPGVRTLRSLPDGSNWNIFTLHIYPNTNHDYDDKNDFRYKDLEANSKRSKLDSILSKSELHLTLKTRLKLEMLNPSVDSAKIQRCIALSQRTNQFNLMNRRIDESSIDNLFRNGYDFITCQLEDAFGDSGIIFFAVVRAINYHEVELYELCISCRALGRHLESLMFSESIAFWGGKKDQDPRRVELQFNSTEKNSAARKWLNSVSYDNDIDLLRLQNSEDILLLKGVVLIERV